MERPEFEVPVVLEMEGPVEAKLFELPPPLEMEMPVEMEVE